MHRFRFSPPNLVARSMIGFLLAASCFAAASEARAQASSEQLRKALSYRPRQADVNYERVEADEYGQCTIEVVSRDEGKGFWITGPAGQPLRWFVDTNADKRPDRWSYYKAGVEVYRESDTDFDGKADEYRWLGTEGLRRGLDPNQDGVIDDWAMISAEEVTAEAVRAAAERDPSRFAALLISEQEIRSLQLGTQKAELLAQRVADARSQFKAWAAGQNVVTAKSRWTNFGADKPGVVPAGTDGSKRDVIVYENVVALLETADEPRQLLVGTMIRVGESWRLVELPRAVSEGAQLSDSGVFFSASFTSRGGESSQAPVQEGISEAMQRLVSELQDVDAKLQQAGGDKEVLQALRADVLEKLVSASEIPSEQSTWIRQFADTVSAASQIGEYPAGAKRLKDFSKKLSSIKASQEDIAYVVYRAVESDYRTRMLAAKESDLDDLQGEYLKSLEAFTRQYPRSPDSADAMIQIALSAEFAGETKKAQGWYQKAKSGFGETLAGRKAAGAMQRLTLEDKPFSLQAETLDGRKFQSSSYRGGPVVYHCWATWCDSCKAEMRALKELRDKYAKHKLRIVGINFDSSPESGSRFLKENSFPWVHLFDQGGLDSDLAVSFGILTLPVNFVVDPSGKVVKTGVHWTELDGLIEDMVK